MKKLTQLEKNTVQRFVDAKAKRDELLYGIKPEVDKKPLTHEQIKEMAKENRERFKKQKTSV
jgi:hypothetical protein